uniref:C-type lectin domain-containing protein n=1 Tax=Sinocyclocheilus rhinocerous TaxID=307959 RepID=A0A673I7D2_9TELE
MCRPTPLLFLHFLPSSALMCVRFSQRHEFVYVPSFLNWTEAQRYCRQRYTDLATFDDQADHNELLKTAGMERFWLGLYRTTGSGAFVWSDQRIVYGETEIKPFTQNTYLSHFLAGHLSALHSRLAQESSMFRKPCNINVSSTFKKHV